MSTWSETVAAIKQTPFFFFLMNVEYQIFRAHCIWGVNHKQADLDFGIVPCGQCGKNPSMLLSKPDIWNDLEIPQLHPSLLAQHPLLCEALKKGWQWCVPHNSSVRLTGLHPSKQIKNKQKRRVGWYKRKNQKQGDSIGWDAEWILNKKNTHTHT